MKCSFNVCSGELSFVVTPKNIQRYSERSMVGSTDTVVGSNNASLNCEAPNARGLNNNQSLVDRLMRDRQLRASTVRMKCTQSRGAL